MPDAAVFLVDDDPSVRKALTRLISSKGYTVESFASANEFLKRNHYDGPACLLLDIQMPGMDGMQLQQELTLAGYLIPIIFITAHGTVPISVQAIKGGAVDFLTKPFTSHQLLSAVDKAIQRNSKKITENSEVQKIKNRVSSLTKREFEVFERVIRGLLNKQVAFELGISEKTVKFHRRRAMEKMQAGSLAELVLFAQKAGIQNSAE